MSPDHSDKNTHPGNHVQESHKDLEPQNSDAEITSGDVTLSDNEGTGTESPSVDRNPEPPKELVEGDLIDADNIRGTVFSKHWLFTTLMKLIKVWSMTKCIFLSLHQGVHAGRETCKMLYVTQFDKIQFIFYNNIMEHFGAFKGITSCSM